MQEELKRCNYIGDQNSIFEFANIAISRVPIEYKSIESICNLNSSIKIRIRPSLILFMKLGLIECSDNKYLGTQVGIEAKSKGLLSFNEAISCRAITYLMEEELIHPSAVFFDCETSTCIIKRSGFPLCAAVFRNLLIETKAIQETNNGVYRISKKYESYFENSFRAKKAKMSLNELFELHKKQEAQGRLAEEFVVEFEKRRLMWCEKSNQVKQISDLDVTAGYDIISFNSSESNSYDRFIEVKSFSYVQSFYWSKNEMNVAREKREKYFLYLVDMSKYQLTGYEPIIVQNPYEKITKTNDWITEAESIKVTRI